MDTISGYIDIILESLNKKNQVLDRIIEFDAAQKALLSAPEVDADEFESSLDIKAELIKQLEDLDEGFTSVYDRVKSELAAHKEEFSSQIGSMKELISQITDKSVRIQAQEARNKKLAQEYFARARKENGQARRTSTMTNSYYKSMHQADSTSQFFDKQK
ncbi:MAG: flagellar export chaperone FlgN [Lachnospiraceae bacterium]